MKAAGKKTSSTAQVLKRGQKGLNMKVLMFLVKRKGKENTLGQMDQYTTDNGLITKLMDLEFIYGLMVVNTMDHGQTTTCKAMEFTFTQMV